MGKLIEFKFEKDPEEKTIEIGKSSGTARQIEPSKKDFTLEWYEKLKWQKNPFEESIIYPIEESFIGREKLKQKLNLFFIENKSYGTISGESGTGKTHIMLWLYSHLLNYQDKYHVYYMRNEPRITREVILPYLNVIEKNFAKVHEEYDFEYITKIIKKIKKEIVLLIDDVVSLTKASRIFFDKLDELDKKYCVVTAGTVDEINHAGFDNMQDQLKIDLDSDQMSIKEIEEILEYRIKRVGGDGIFPLKTKDMHNLCKKARFNLAKILQICEKECIKRALDNAASVDLTKEEITLHHAKKEKRESEEADKHFEYVIREVKNQ